MHCIYPPAVLVNILLSKEQELMIIDFVIICWKLAVFVVIGLPSNQTDFNSDKKREKMT